MVISMEDIVKFLASYSPERGDEVLKATEAYLEREGLLEQINELLMSYQSIGSLVPQTIESFWSGHFFPFTESHEELEVSLNLCILGFYKQSMCCLRSCLELGLLSVYWNLHDDGHLTIKQWLSSREETPRLSEIYATLMKHGGFARFQGLYDFRSRLLGLNFLSNYVHTRGYRFSNKIGLPKSNFQTFQHKGVDRWYKASREVASVVALLHLIKYPVGALELDIDAKFGLNPPMGGFPSLYERSKIKCLIEDGTFEIVEQFARADENAMLAYEHFRNLPDLTPEQFEQQVLDWDRQYVEMNGFDEWKRIEQSKASVCQSKAEQTRKRIDEMRAWAEEKGFLESRFDRTQRKKLAE